MRSRLLAGLFVALISTSLARAAVVINEFVYDDGGTGGTDDREFVELYNNGGSAVDISGWTLGGRDNSGATPPTNNVITTIPGALGSGTTMLAAGSYYVIGNTGVPNVSQVAAGGFLENSSETIELFNGAFNTSTLQDGLVFEGYRGPTNAPVPATPADGYGPLQGNMPAEVGGATIWGIYTLGDEPGTITSVGRYVNGVDTNNNGRDFGLRPATPGASNGTVGTQYTAANVDALADGDTVPGLFGSFVKARVMTPTVAVDGLNQIAIAAPPSGATKAITVWDPTGGGNAAAADVAFAGTQKFDIYAYIDTDDMPQNTNGAGTPFRGSEFSFFGLGGSIDGNAGVGAGSAFGLQDVSGQIGNTGDSATGTTGIAWYYEKVNVGISEKLYLIDAGDGGNQNADPGNATADEWTVLATIDLSTEAPGTSAWRRLSIEVDAAGNGVARFDTQTFNFTTLANLNGSFYVGYRENTQDGADGTPTFMRPPTFTQFAAPGAADADFDDSGTVDGRDLLIWQQFYGGAGTPTTGDATGDGQVNDADFVEWKLKFGGPPAVAAGGAVPEPATGLMGAMALLGVAALRRRVPRQ